MPYFDFRQNNSGGSFEIDEQAGISVNVIIEAKSEADAIRKAERIGLYWDGCASGRDCSCCGNRWSNSWIDEKPVPSVYSIEVHPGDLHPAEDEGGWSFGKSAPEGSPEGFIHYMDGRVEPFWATTKERQDLDGNYGWGVRFGRTYVETFLCGFNGWDATGNCSAPWAEHHGSGEKPDKPMVEIDNDHHYGEAWFPTKEEADQFANLLELSLVKISEDIHKIANSLIVGELDKNVKKALQVWKN